MRFPAYPGYKASGAAWLGDVPHGWQVQHLFVVLRETDRPNRDSGERNLLSLSYGRIVPKDINTLEGLLPESFETYQIVEEGEIVLRLTDLQNDQRSLRVGAVPERGIVTSAYVNLRAQNGLNPRFAFYFLHSVDVQKVFYNYGGGVRQSMRFEDLRRLPVPVPPLPEQRAIGDFLDAQTAKLDTLIEKKRRLIELLREKRSALISRTVTRGLPPDVARAAGIDPHPKLKDSGVEWLGEIPKHWKVKRLKYLTRQITVGIVVEPSQYYEDEGVPALRSLNVRPNQLTSNDLVYISEDSNHVLAKSMVREGDLVTVRSGQPGTTAVVDRVYDGANCIDLIITRKPPQESAIYVSLYLNSDAATAQFAEGAGGAIQQHFNIGTAKDLLVALPPIREQLAIVDFVAREAGKIDRMIEKVEVAIERLAEYRAALITDAITGKIDVRQAVA